MRRSKVNTILPVLFFWLGALPLPVLGQYTAPTSNGFQAAVSGLIGKATSLQRKLKPMLAALEASAGGSDERLLQARTLHLQAARDLQTAYNIGSATWSSNTQVWYYATAKVQNANVDRLARVANGPSAAESTDSAAAGDETTAAPVREVEAPAFPEEPSEISDTWFYDHDE